MFFPRLIIYNLMSSLGKLAVTCRDQSRCLKAITCTKPLEITLLIAVQDNYNIIITPIAKF